MKTTPIKLADLGLRFDAKTRTYHHAAVSAPAHSAHDVQWLLLGNQARKNGRIFSTATAQGAK